MPNAVFNPFVFHWSQIISFSLCMCSKGGDQYLKIWCIHVCVCVCVCVRAFVLACRNKGLNRGWVDLESWQVHYCSRLCLAWHVCVPNLPVIWQSCVGAWAGSLLSVVTHTHTPPPPLSFPFVQHTHTHTHTGIIFPSWPRKNPPLYSPLAPSRCRCVLTCAMRAL